MMSDQKNTGLVIRLAIAWIIVLIPLGWGLYNTLVKATPLFET